MAEVAALTHPAGQAQRHDLGGYRPDIDGLRGVAVLLVVLWHAGVPGVRGGYAGVDVFFVISGFVITGSLQRDAGGRGISILGFYARRLRRIAPAFLAMLAAVMAAGFVIQLPAELTRTAGVALGGLGLVANVVLWRQGGYWGGGADTEPLRHVWSLSIEEQFYLVYPALLALLLARAPKAASPVLAGLAALSLGLFLLLFRGSPEAAFELGPARAWELMIGCLCALQARNWRAPRLADEALMLAGAAMLGVAAFGGVVGKPPTIMLACLGAALIVLCGRTRPLARRPLARQPLAGQPLVSRALAAPPLLAVGLASYSLYLWHWPLLALARSLRPTGIGAAETALLLAATAVLGFASWRFVEQPLRRPWPDGRTRRRFFAICGALAAFSVGAAVLALAGDGWPQRLAPRVAAIAAFEDFNRTAAWRAQVHPWCFAQRASLADYDAARCFTAAPGRRNVLLWGDSHAAQLAGPLAAVAARLGAHLMQATMPTCAPAFGPGPAVRGCRRFDALTQARLKTQPADVVVITFSAVTPSNGVLDEVDALTRGGARVILVGPTPQYTVLVAPTLARTASAPDLSPWMMPQPFTVDAELRAAAAGRPGVRYVSAIDLFCPTRCALFTPSGAPLIWDRNHLTPDAAQLLTAQIAGPLAEALRAGPAPPPAATAAPRS